MPGADGFAVSREALASHARAVDAVADDVDLARRAGDQVRLGREAYGRLCQMLPAVLEPVQQTAIDTLREVGDSLRACADGLRAAGQRYDATDLDVGRRFDDLRGDG